MLSRADGSYRGSALARVKMYGAGQMRNALLREVWCCVCVGQQWLDGAGIQLQLLLANVVVTAPGLRSGRPSMYCPSMPAGFERPLHQRQ